MEVSATLSLEGLIGFRVQGSILRLDEGGQMNRQRLSDLSVFAGLGVFWRECQRATTNVQEEQRDPTLFRLNAVTI